MCALVDIPKNDTCFPVYQLIAVGEINERDEFLDGNREVLQ